MNKLIALALGTMLATGAAQAATFDVNQVIGTGGVVGTIETDGTLGSLTAGNIVDFDLTLTDTSGSFVLDGGSNAGVAIVGSAFSATATQLLFDFTTSNTYALFQNPVPGSGINFYCIATQICGGLQGNTVGLAFGSQVSNSPTSSSFVVGTIGQQPSPVPLPASSLLLVAGLGGLAAMRRRKTAA